LADLYRFTTKTTYGGGRKLHARYRSTFRHSTTHLKSLTTVHPLKVSIEGKLDNAFQSFFELKLIFFTMNWIVFIGALVEKKVWSTLQASIGIRAAAFPTKEGDLAFKTALAKMNNVD